MDALQDKLAAVFNMCFGCEVAHFCPLIKVITLTIFRLGSASHIYFLKTLKKFKQQ